ncbi:MAG: DUF5706 domain-containing protein [Thermaerobacter sp.]|jgi:hypothetical protein|nr:DUF5706 domain-containing protein [Thermaerobacter sp.]
MPVTDERGRLPLAQWILERNLDWIAAAEVKVGVIVAIDTVMLGTLATIIGIAHPAAQTCWPYLVSAIALISLIAGMFCAAMTVLPRVKGPDHSLVFCGRIARFSQEKYAAELKQATDEDIMGDVIKQIHRNAEIAVTKFIWVRRSMWASFASGLPWLVAIMLLMKG